MWGFHSEQRRVTQQVGDCGGGLFFTGKANNCDAQIRRQVSSKCATSSSLGADIRPDQSSGKRNLSLSGNLWNRVSSGSYCPPPVPANGPMSPGACSASSCASILRLYSPVNLRRFERATTSGFGRGARKGSSSTHGGLHRILRWLRAAPGRRCSRNRDAGRWRRERDSNPR
jgi:hypothetical protein